MDTKLPAHAIRDLLAYNGHMRAGLNDKLFFLDKVDHVDCFIDFGCADGSLLQAVGRERPGALLVGVDIDPEMRALCADTIRPRGTGRNMVMSTLPRHYGHTCLILSSVLHEMGDCNGFLDEVVKREFSYIAIRDMGVNPYAIDIPEWVQDNKTPGVSYRAKVQHLLKYRYEDDAEREAQEDYLRNSPLDMLLWAMAQHTKGYTVTHFDHHSHPFTRSCVERDHGIEFADRTHFTLVLESRDARAGHR